MDGCTFGQIVHTASNMSNIGINGYQGFVSSFKNKS